MTFSSKLKKAAIGIIGSAIIAGTPLVSKAESPKNAPHENLETIVQVEKVPTTNKTSVFVGLATNGKETVKIGTQSVMQFEHMFEFLNQKWAISYINEGQFSEPKHHRDGVAGQYWIKKGNFSAGAGGYLYYDTTEDWSNVHGLGGIFSLNAEYPITKNLSGNIRTNFILARKMNTNSFMAGLSYNISPDKDFKENKKQEITLFPVGGSFPNTNNAQAYYAYGAEYRLNLKKNIDWTVGYLDEKRRNGVNSQLWAVKKMNKISLGAGGGVYLANRTNLIVSLTGSYDISEKLNARATWSRITTDNHDDADVILLGLGYKF
jgi:hypothetical protein